MGKKRKLRKGVDYDYFLADNIVDSARIAAELFRTYKEINSRELHKGWIVTGTGRRGIGEDILEM